MRRSLLFLPLFALAGCADTRPSYQYPAPAPAPCAYPAQSACAPVSPCSPAYRPYQYSNYVPQVAPQGGIQQTGAQMGPPAPPQTGEPPR